MPSLKLISATDTQYSTAVLKSLNEQRNNGLFCDVTIVVQDKKFRAHRTILSASSSYFNQLFSVAVQVVELNFIRPEIFEQILNYIYSSRIFRVRSDMLEELIAAGKVLGVKFIANLGSPLSHVKGLPGLSKDPENKNDTSTEIMPIITESFSISAEEFNQASKPAGNEEDSDSDVVFVSSTDTSLPKAISGEIIDLEKADSESGAAKEPSETNPAVATQENAATSPPGTCAAKPPGGGGASPSVPVSSPLHGPDSRDHNPAFPGRVFSGSAPATPVRPSSFPPEQPGAPPSSGGVNGGGVHKKQVSASSQQGDFRIRLSDVSDVSAFQAGVPEPAVVAKKTVTLDTATEIDSISSGCKVYANIGEDTYDIVPLKEDPGEGGSKANKGKRSLMATPLKPVDKAPLSPKAGPQKKRTKTELEDHYELIMDGKTFYVCVVCKRPYVCLPSLRRHFNTHSWEKKYPCRHCDKVFALAEYRTKHEIHHTGERRYQCLLCNEMFINYQLLSTHCKQVHNQDPSGKKEKDDGANNLYRLLPCRTVPMKSYSWVTDGPGDPLGSDGGGGGRHRDSVHPSVQSRMLNWDDIFVEPDARLPPSSHKQPAAGGAAAINATPPGPSEFEFVTPERY
ncbi:unnamed protein product [Menidia menidia]|uniref:(Atlantic silverside) hypothetical protein n=1 Tax=Menidia menidia TaxID=238744 RepID=A0A8S4BH46_9TELE|nr:unnamed protein product [Menidia menidia]